jgi:hypothetical protein
LELVRRLAGRDRSIELPGIWRREGVADTD